MRVLSNIDKKLPNIVIFGGTGFVGSNLIRKLVDKHQLNEKFNIIIPSTKSSFDHVKYTKNVHYCGKISIFEPLSFNEVINLKNNKFIIHSIGTFNNDLAYKNLVKNVSIFQSIPIFIKNFVTKSLNNQHQKNDINFIKYNYTTLQKLLEALKDKNKNKPKLMYLSANKSCITDMDYIKSKRMAENLLKMEEISKILEKSIIYRPGVMFTDHYKNKFDFFIKNMIFNKDSVSIRDVMSLLISNNLVVNRDEYFTNVDKLTDKIISDIIQESEAKNEKYEVEIVDKTKFLK